MKTYSLTIPKQVNPYYTIEILKYKVFYNCFISPKEALQIIALLQNHFKIYPNSIKFNYKSRKFGGRCIKSKLIFVKDGLNVGIVCHEFAHLKYKSHKNDFIYFLQEIIFYIQKKITYKLEIK
jgi:hypothetical protein